jgi:hypothetical protein
VEVSKHGFDPTNCFLEFLRIAQFSFIQFFHSDDVINAFIQKVFILDVATTPLKEKNTCFSLWSSKFPTRALKIMNHEIFYFVGQFFKSSSVFFWVF